MGGYPLVFARRHPYGHKKMCFPDCSITFAHPGFYLVPLSTHWVYRAQSDKEPEYLGSYRSLVGSVSEEQSDVIGLACYLA